MRGYLLLALAALVCASCALDTAYDDQLLVTAEVDARFILEHLSKDEIDIWGRRGNVFDLRMSSATFETFKTLGYKFHVRYHSLAPLLKAEKMARQSREKKMWEPGTEGGFFDEFREFDEFNEYLNLLVAKYPSLLTSFNAGTTVEGRTIPGIILSNGDHNKSAIYMEALQHAREWLAPTTNLWILTKLVEEYVAGDTTAVQLVNAYDWHVVPIVNIDGYIYSWEEERLWRKNRRQNSRNVYGVDLNRNWGPNNTWCTSGSSTLPSSDTYCGTAPFSEPESLSMSENLARIPNIKAAIDFHTYGPLLLHPYQYTYDSAPEPYNTLVSTLGKQMENAINGVYDEGYESIQGSDLYPHSGGFIDYAYHLLGVPAFTIELRGNGFIVPATEIPLAARENYEGVKTLAKALLSD